MNNLSIWKKISIVAGAIGAVLGVMISWQAMDHVLPRWAWWNEVQAIESKLLADQADMQMKLTATMDRMEQQVASNTRLILGQEWERLRAKIYDLRAKLAQRPADRALHEELARLEAQLRDVERELDPQ
jgi:hypothetical protein